MKAAAVLKSMRNVLTGNSSAMVPRVVNHRNKSPSEPTALWTVYAQFQGTF
jgi:hypothetical protein